MSTAAHSAPASFGAAQRCLPCARKGHTCYAARVENGEPVCIYCLDGEPCFYEQRNKSQKESPMPELQPTTAKPNGHVAKKYCPGYQRECGEVLSERNQNGLCSKCYGRKWYAENKAAGEPKLAKKAAPVKSAKPRKVAPEWQKENRAPKTHLADAPPSGSRVTLEVTESQLNKFLTGLPLAEKQRLANHYLQTAEV